MFRLTGMVNSGMMVHNAQIAVERDWFSYTGRGDNSRFTGELRQIVEERIRGRGRLLGVFQVRVYENGCEPYVPFQQGAAFGVETDQSVIEEMVARSHLTS